MDVQVLKSYSHNGLCRAVDIFNYPNEVSKKTRLLGFRFLLQYRHIDTVTAPSKEAIIKQMKEMIDDHYEKGTQESYSILMELVDMLIDYSPPDGEKLLAYLREKRATANDAGPGSHDAGPECTVYGDSQSTHNKEISDSTRRAAKYLAQNFAKTFPPGPEGVQAKMQYYEQVKNALIERYGENMGPVIDRIYMDNAHFGIGYTVDEVLMALLEWINYKARQYTDDPEKKGEGIKFPVKEVFSRLGEELAEMENYCASGLLARLINAIQGFTDDDENLAIRISNREQVKTVVYNHLNRAIQESCDEDVLEGMTDGGEKFLSFVKKEIADHVDGWYAEYGDDFLQHLMDVVNEYTSAMTYE